jgi:hypothetical protein
MLFGHIDQRLVQFLLKRSGSKYPETIELLISLLHFSLQGQFFLPEEFDLLLERGWRQNNALLLQIFVGFAQSLLFAFDFGPEQFPAAVNLPGDVFAHERSLRQTHDVEYAQFDLNRIFLRVGRAWQEQRRQG